MSEMEFIDIFGDNLRSILKDYRMTPRELAQASGVPESSISRYLKKQYMPTVKSLFNIATALSIDINELIEVDELIV